jgi:DNA-binding GntR family transcriptional regulator
MTTAKNKAYDFVRDGILRGSFPPGTHLKEEPLAEQSGLGRTPIRFAIKRLAEEGLVSIGENRRGYVRDVDPDDAEEVFDIWILLESHSAGLAATKITDQEIEDLEAIQVKIEQLVDARPMDDIGFLDLNADFHKTIHRAAKNAALLAVMERFANFPYNIYVKIGMPTESATATKDHRRILDALADRDGELASLLMRLHLEHVRRQFRYAWNEVNPPEEGH